MWQLWVLVSRCDEQENKEKRGKKKRKTDQRNRITGCCAYDLIKGRETVLDGRPCVTASENCSQKRNASGGDGHWDCVVYHSERITLPLGCLITTAIWRNDLISRHKSIECCRLLTCHLTFNFRNSRKKGSGTMDTLIFHQSTPPSCVQNCLKWRR